MRAVLADEIQAKVLPESQTKLFSEFPQLIFEP